MLQPIPTPAGAATIARPRPGRLPHEPRPAPTLRLVPSLPADPPIQLGERNPALIRRAYPLLTALVDHYYRAEIEGVEHLSDRASLLVSTHHGGIFNPEMYTLFVAYWRRFGLEAPGYGLVHAAALRFPGLGRLLRAFGAIPASNENGQAALRTNAPLLVCPGGDLDALKPYWLRHRVVFGGRRGFIRLALREQVPIIPVVSVGAHETLFVLNDGRRLARLLRIDKIMRAKTAPFTLSFPNGLSIAGIGGLPLPSKVRLRILPPMRFDLPPDAADDPDIVERCAREVRDVMQRAVDELAARRRFPILG